MLQSLIFKGLLAVPLIERAKEIYTPDGLYQYKVVPFGCRYVPQCLINSMIADVPGCEALR